MYQHKDISWCDTETRSECNLKDHGAFVYAEHPSTEIIMIQWAINDGPVRVWQIGDPWHPDELFNWIEGGGKVAFHNATFDYLMFRHAIFDGMPMRKRVELRRSQLVCTSAWAAASNLPQSLAPLCKVLGLPKEFHKAPGGALINKFCKPRKPSKTNSDKWWTKETAPEQWADFVHYGKQDIVAMRTAAGYFPALSPYEQEVWQHTLVMNMRGVPVDVEECRKIIAIVEQEKAHLNAVAARISNGAFTKVTEKQKVKDWMTEHYGVTLLNDEGKVTLAAEYVDKALAGNDLPFDVWLVLGISRQVNQTSVKKFDKMIDIASADGTIKGMYVYHGAGPGRYASKGGLNLQNLKTPKKGDVDPLESVEVLCSLPHSEVKTRYPDLIQVASLCARSVIKAPEGFDFINEDYSSIENRIANWIAGQDDIVAGYRDGLDEYKLLAVKMYDVVYDEVTKDQRRVAKSGVLGGQFGQGWKGMITFADGQGVTLTKKKSKELIKSYRDSHKKVQSHWYELGDLAIQAIEYPGARRASRKHLTVFMCPLNLFLCLQLPSGRVIKWFKPRVVMALRPPIMTDLAGEKDYDDYIGAGWGESRMVDEGVMHRRLWAKTIRVMSKDRDRPTWYEQMLLGSSIFQSAVQGIARDLLVHGMMNLEAGGYPIVLTTHDEAQPLMRIGQGSEEEFDRLFCDTPDWAEGLPVVGESWRGERYRK